MHLNWYLNTCRWLPCCQHKASNSAACCTALLFACLGLQPFYVLAKTVETSTVWHMINALLCSRATAFYLTSLTHADFVLFFLASLLLQPLTRRICFTCGTESSSSGLLSRSSETWRQQSTLQHVHVLSCRSRRQPAQACGWQQLLQQKASE